MKDIIVNIGNSIIQHGKFNDRIYLMKLSKKDVPDIMEDLNRMAHENGYTKIFAKVPAFAKSEFDKNGYIEEASIPKFYNGNEDLYFMAKYFSKLRMFEGRISEIGEILEIAKSKIILTEKDIGILPVGFDYKICDKSHIFQIADEYKKVFNTYPFPIFDPQYIAETMNENFIYFSIQKNKHIVAMSSSEMDIESRSVEMTDFATLPEYQGKGFALYLLSKMEKEMRTRDIKTTYTIARALSRGANIIFAKMGYKFGGTLFNNTKISTKIEVSSGNFESMNVWYKYI